MDYRDINIIYEDNHLLVVAKPPNVLSQADSTGDPDMLTLLKEYIKVTYEKPGNVYLGLVHRLDRPVGGVMVFAKTSKAASRLSDQIRQDLLGKKYLAVVWGRPQKRGRLLNYLHKDSRTNMVRVVSKNTRGAKQALLDYEQLATDKSGELSLVRINLHTGRPHQIRVQMQNIGFPLYGDQRYGLRHKPLAQIALWAETLSFNHPTLKKNVEFKMAPPKVEPWTRFRI